MVRMHGESTKGHNMAPTVGSLTRRALLASGAVGAAFPAATPSIVNTQSCGPSTTMSPWRPWLFKLLHVVSRSKTLTRNGWVRDKEELGISWLRVRLLDGEEDTSFTFRPHGREPHIAIEAKRALSDAIYEECCVVGDWDGAAFTHNEYRGSIGEIANTKGWQARQRIRASICKRKRNKELRNV
jgi:hypothetical protein